jgi:hypothetical protein
VRGHKGGVRIGKTPKKLDNIFSLKAEKISRYFKATEGKEKGPGSGEKVSSRRINLEGNTHIQEIKASQLPV